MKSLLILTTQSHIPPTEIYFKYNGFTFNQ